MVNDHELSTRLQRTLPADEIPLIVGRLVRVPEAWAALHDETLLEKALAGEHACLLTPPALAMLALGFDGMPVERLPEDTERELSLIWESACQRGAAPQTLREVGFLAIGLRRHAVSEGAERTATLVLAAPLVWRSAVACAWSSLPEAPAVLRALVTSEGTSGLPLAAGALLANLSIDSSASALFSAMASAIGRTQLAAIAATEPELARALAALATHAGPDSVGEAKVEVVSGEPDGLLDRAAVLIAQGALTEAGGLLQNAWNATHRQTAEIADAMAEVADRESNPVVAIEARRQGLQFHATPERRAVLALALAQTGRPDEAMHALPQEGRSPEELVAAAAASLETGDIPPAQIALRQAMDGFRAHAEPPLPWMDRLATELSRAGLNELALEALGGLVGRRPGDAMSRGRYAEALTAAADYDRGAAEASAALLLDPALVSARRSLAACLQSSGRPEAALDHWKGLAERDPSALPALGQCALEAGDLELASSVARTLLERDPASSLGRILTGEVMLRRGQDGPARAEFEEAARADPTNAGAWIALARSQAAAGDGFAAGATLTHAAQLLPQNPEIWAALAAHFQSHGQAREALDAIERAVRISPTRADWLAFLGETSFSLGLKERAATALSEALALRPGDNSARMTLAHLRQEEGDIAGAAELVLHLRQGLTGEDRLNAARILILQAEGVGNAGGLPVAGEHLRIAAEEGHEAQVAFWSGRLHEAAGEPEAAFESYRRAQSLIAETDAAQHKAVCLGLARSAVAIGQPALALATLEAALADHPTSVELHLALSQAALAADLGDRALQAARQAFDLDRSSAAAAAQLARSALALEAWETAATALEQVASLAPDDLDARFLLAETCLKAGDRASARETLAAILRANRNSPDVLLRAAPQLVSLAAPAAARLALRRAAGLLPPESDLWRSLAAAGEEIGDLETAQHAWCRLAESHPKDVEALTHAAGSMWELGRRSAAIGLWQRSVALDPENAELHRQLANAYVANGETAVGLNHFSQAMHYAPADPALAKEAGEAALRHGAAQEALDILKHASRLAPHDPEILTALAQALLRLGKPKECLTVLASAASRAELPPTGYALHAVASAATGDVAASRSSLQEAFRRAPRSVEEASWVSRAAILLGEWAPAIAVFDRVAEAKSPDGPPPTRLARLAATARALEAHAVLSLAGVRAHLPEIEGLLRRADGDMTELSKSSAASGDLEFLRARISLAKGTRDEAPAGAEAGEGTSDPRLAASRAINHVRNGRFQQALDLLSSSPAVRAENWVPILRGVAHAGAGNPAEARREFELASGDPVFGPAAACLTATSWIDQGDVDQAIRALNTALAAWPGEPEWHSRLAALYLDGGNLAAALPHLQQAAEIEPQSPAYGLALSRAFRADGQISQAKEAYAKILDHYPTDGDVWKEAGEIALMLGEAELASGWLERACTLSPSDAQAILAYAQAAHALGHSREAADRARAAARLAPEDPEILLGLGEILARQGKLDKALEAYDKALEHAANPLPVQLARCRLLTRLGRPTQAVAALEQLAEGEPSSDAIWGALAEAREADGQTEPAIEAAARAARLAPRSPSHHLALARLSRKTGQLDRALDEAHQAQVLAPADAAVHVELGAIYEHRRETGQALQAYQKAIGLDQNSPEAHFRAGLVLKSLKSYSQAARMFRRAVDLNPKDATAAHQLAAVRALELVHGGTLHTAVPT